MIALLVIVVLGLLMWLLLVRPQRRRQNEQEQLLSNLQVGDEVVTAGGIYGRIEDVCESEVTLEIAPGTSVRIAKRAVAGIMTEEEEDEGLEEAAEDELEDPSVEAEEQLEAGHERSTAERRG